LNSFPFAGQSDLLDYFQISIRAQCKLNLILTNRCNVFSSYISLSLFTDCTEGDDAGARERDPESADSDSSGGGAIIATHVDQATHSDTIHRTIAFVDDARDALSSAHDREFRLLDC